MSIRQELAAELTDAMKQRDRDRTAVIRQIETEVATAKAAPGFAGEVDDALYREVMATFVKRMGKARAEFEAAGERGREHVAKLTYEIEYLSRWLPDQAGEEETRSIVRGAIAELGADDPKMAGRVIGHIMRAGHAVDGALVNRLVGEELGAG